MITFNSTKLSSYFFSHCLRSNVVWWLKFPTYPIINGQSLWTLSQDPHAATYFILSSDWLITRHTAFYSSLASSGLIYNTFFFPCCCCCRGGNISSYIYIMAHHFLSRSYPFRWVQNVIALITVTIVLPDCNTDNIIKPLIRQILH